MRSGDGDRVTEPHQLGEHFGAPHDRHQAFAGGGDLGIVVIDGAGDDDGIGVLDIVGSVADKHGGAEPLEPRVCAFSLRSEPCTR